jgi:hypothetical protein
MTTNLTAASASKLAQYDQARRTAALTGAATPITPVTQPPPQVTAASAQATEGAEQAQPREEFNARRLDLPPDPTSLDVRLGLVRAMADPTVNHATAAQLFQLHEQLMQAEKAMMQVIIDGMLI